MCAMHKIGVPSTYCSLQYMTHKTRQIESLAEELVHAKKSEVGCCLDKAPIEEKQNKLVPTVATHFVGVVATLGVGA